MRVKSVNPSATTRRGATRGLSRFSFDENGTVPFGGPGPSGGATLSPGSRPGSLELAPAPAAGQRYPRAHARGSLELAPAPAAGRRYPRAHARGSCSASAHRAPTRTAPRRRRADARPAAADRPDRGPAARGPWASCRGRHRALEILGPDLQPLQLADQFAHQLDQSARGRDAGEVWQPSGGAAPRR